MKQFLLVFVVLWLLHGGSAFAAVEPRIALVIGNSNYAIAPLANPVNDARLIAATLRKLGFEVNLRLDADQKTMKYAIVEFGERHCQR